MDTRSMFYGAPPSVFEKARWLRKNETNAEKILWQGLGNKKLLNLRFKRQHPISNFVADFYCHQMKLVIEIDELYHSKENQIIHDAHRNLLMGELGISVLRFTEHEITHELSEVVERIKKWILNSKQF